MGTLSSAHEELLPKYCNFFDSLVHFDVMADAAQ
jgi:hypothetical protein